VRVLAVSPHLDDAVFSAGGELATLADAGHDVTVVTCFTATMPDPSGFALACQTDKGLAPDVDYMALRRDEDHAAMAVLGVHALHLTLPEAPHRGYTSPADLFAGIHQQDRVEKELVRQLGRLAAEVWLAPQGLGRHVDHLHVVRAVARLRRPTAWWRDAPYVLREPDAQPSPDLPTGLASVRLFGNAPRRADACACYRSQLGFQFGGEQRMRAALAGLDEPLLADPAAKALLACVGAAAGC